MTTEGWIFMVGLRVFDVGGLIVWMVWFFRLRESDDDEPFGDDDQGGGGNQPATPPPAPAPPGLDLPKPDAEPWPHRRRDHEGDRTPAVPPARRTRRTPERV